MAVKRILKENDVQILPVTRLDCVVDMEGNLMNTVIAQMKKDIYGGDGVGSLYVTVADFGTFKEANTKAIADAVKGEKERAELAEQGLAGDIAKINTAISVETGLGKDVADLKSKDTELEGKINAKVAQTDYDAKMGVLEAEDTRIAGLVATEKSRAEGKEGELLTAIQALEGKVGDTVVDTAIQKVIDDQKLVNENLQKAADAAQDDADALEQRLDAEGGLVDRLEAVEDFKQKHSHATIEQGIADNKAAIDVLKGGAEVAGSVAKAVADAVKVEKDRAESAEGGLASRITVFEANGDLDVAALKAIVEANAEFVDAQPAIDEAQDNRLKILEGLVVGGEGQGIEAVIADVAKNTAAITTLNGNANTEGSVAKAVATALATAQGEVQAEAKNREDADKALDERIKKFEAGGANDVAALTGRVSANENAIAKLNGDANTAGSVAKAVADGIAGVVASAPEDFDTLKEIADWIANDKTGAAGLQSGVAANAAAIEKLNGDASTEGSVAKAVKAEETRATLAEQGLAERIAAFEGKEGSLAKLAARVKANEDFVVAHSHTKMEQDIAANAAAIEAINKADTGILAQAKAYADGKNTAIQNAQDAAAAAQAGVNAINHETTGILAKAKAYADGKDAAIAAAKKAGDDAQADVDVLEGVVGNAEGGLVKDVNDLKAINAETRLSNLENNNLKHITCEDPGTDFNYSTLL